MKKEVILIGTVIISILLIFSSIIFLRTDDGNVDSNPISFPEEEWPHQESTEWYYWTGHLETEDGRWFGYELVFFIINIGSQKILVVNHAISDILNDEFHYTIANSNGPIPKFEEPLHFQAGVFSAFIEESINTLYGEVDNFTIDLHLESVKLPVLQHGDGYIDYPFGGYTYYYSRTRMETNGTITIDNKPYAVFGTSWFDHQWGSLEAVTNLGWDWFAIQLDDGREIMLFNVHQEGELLIGGSLVDANGTTVELASEDVTTIVKDEWVSPHTGRIYPSGWEIKVKDIDLTLTSVMKDQELAYDYYNKYWEGVCTVTGDVKGRAYVELVGSTNSSQFATGQNILQNSGFEEGLQGEPLYWTAVSMPAENLTMSWDSETKYNGTRSVCINNTHIFDEAVNNNWQQSITSIPIGRIVELSGFVKTINSEDVVMVIQCWDKYNSIVGFGTTEYQYTINGTTDWQMYKASVKVPDETVKISVLLALSNTGQVWFDDVQLVVT